MVWQLRLASVSRGTPAKVFIAYRRSDAARDAGRIYDWLSARLGRENIFKDVDSIPPGVDFRKAITCAIASANVMLVLIGTNWLEMTSETGCRRVDDEDDVHRFEIEEALRRELKVIPLLMDGAKMPAEKELPGTISSLARHHAVAVRLDPDFHRDMERILREIQTTAGSSRVDRPARSSSSLSPATASNVNAVSDTASGRAIHRWSSRRRLIVLVLVALILVFCGSMRILDWNKRLPPEEPNNELPQRRPDGTPAVVTPAKQERNEPSDAGVVVGEHLRWNQRGELNLFALRKAIPKTMPVWRIEFSPDGRNFVTVGDDGITQVWRVPDKEKVAELIWPGDTGTWTKCVFSPDSERLAIGTGMLPLHPPLDLYTLVKKRSVKFYEKVRCGVSAVAFSPNGEVMAVATNSGDGMSPKIDLWDWRKEQRVVSLNDGPTQLLFSGNGKMLASWSQSQPTVNIWAVDPPPENGEAPRLKLTHPELARIGGVAFSPLADTIAVGFQVDRNDPRGAVWLWDLAKGVRREKVPGADNAILSIAYPPEGDQIVIADKDKVSVRNAATFAETHAFRGRVVNSTFGPLVGKDRQAVMTQSGSELTLWDTRTGKKLAAPLRTDAPFRLLALSPTGAWLAAVDQKSVRLWTTLPKD
jgi:WD40 repeat protein